MTKETIASIWHEHMLGYLLADIICTTTWTVFQNQAFEEQILSKNKFPKSQMKAIGHSEIQRGTGASSEL